MKRAALLLAVLTGACAAAPTPTRDELAEALGAGAPAVSTDITHIACEASSADAAEVVCRWRQRDGRQWRDWQSHLALAGEDWQLVDTPTLRP